MKMKNKVTVLLGVLTAILIGMLMLAAQGASPMESYGSILQYSLGTAVGRANTINRFVFLTLAGASAAVALGSGVSNLGQQGQILMGAFAAALTGIYVPAPGIVLVPLMILVGVIVGALYAGIAALAKRYLGMNEFITTLMLNFLANFLVEYLIATPFKDPGTQWPATYVIARDGILPVWGKIDSAALIMLVVYAAMVYFFKKSRLGYELRVMGQNSLFAKVGGCETGKNFFVAMLLSGALAGILGVMLIIGGTQQHRVISGLVGSYPDNGLMLSIVAGNDISGVFVYAILFSILQSGSTGMQLDTGVPSEFTTMLIAITVLSVVAFRAYANTFINKMIARRKILKLEEGAK